MKPISERTLMGRSNGKSRASRKDSGDEMVPDGRAWLEAPDAKARRLPPVAQWWSARRKVRR